MRSCWPEAQIISVNGVENLVVEFNDRRARVAVLFPYGLRSALKQALEEHPGEEAEIKYRPSPLAEPETVKVAISEDMVEPWVGLMHYVVDISAAGETMTLKKSNPFAALRVGMKKTYYFVMQVYQMMERMIVSRSLGVDKISGPVGIVKLGSMAAESGWKELFFFLAIISANLAVINFLPLPIVDGGHMVFLIIEKIKGSPVSIKVQAATQVVGLALIGFTFLYVTLQDFFR